MLSAALQERWISTLQKCRQRKDVQEAKRLLAYLHEQQLESHPVVGNYLVPMLAACGNLLDAQLIFDKLPLSERTVYAWNTLISAYVNHGHPQHAFHLYHQMLQQEDCAQPNRCAYLALLNACTRLKDTISGRRMHADIIKRGLERDFYNGSALLGNTLVDMYGKCGSHSEARRVFDGLPARNTISWNALISGYSENGFGKEAGDCFHRMQLEGISPDPVTFVCSLKACSTKTGLKLGQCIHSEIIKRGFEKEVYLGNTLVDMYIKTKSFSEANNVFNWLPTRDAVSWNALIGGFAEHGLADEVRNCFQRMQQENISPDAVTLVNSLKACATKKALDSGREMHTESTKRGLEKAAYVGNTLLDMYTKCSSLAEALGVFERLIVRDGVSWAALIVGYAEHGMDDEVLTFFKRMQLQGVSGERITFVSCLKACGHMGALETGREIHEEIRKSGLVSDLFICSMLIDMYGKCGSVAEGQEVFDKLHERDVVLWTAMIQAYGENHDANMAIRCFASMQEQGLKPDAITFTCILAACSHASLVLKGQEYFKLMVEEYGIEPNSDHCSCMVDLFARSGLVYEAERFLAAMQLPPTSMILVALLTACRIYGRVELGERCFQQILEVNEDVASACLLMADLYASAERWVDASRLEGQRKYTGALKKPGSAVIEVDKKLHEFLVCFNQSRGTLELIDILQLRMKYSGFVPNLDLIPRHTSDEDKEARSVEFLDNY